jgi:hypothetical protein
MSEMIERVARAIHDASHSINATVLLEYDWVMDMRLAQARAAIEAQVEWLREFGNHPPAPNCPRCNAADQITAALGEGE